MKRFRAEFRPCPRCMAPLIMVNGTPSDLYPFVLTAGKCTTHRPDCAAMPRPWTST